MIFGYDCTSKITGTCTAFLLVDVSVSDSGASALRTVCGHAASGGLDRKSLVGASGVHVRIRVLQRRFFS